MNLSSLLRSISVSSKRIKVKLTWFSHNSNSSRNLITKWSCHRESGDVLSLEPNPQRTYWLPIMIPKGVYSPSKLLYPCCFVCLARLLIPGNCFTLSLSICISSCYNSSRIADVWAEEFLTKSHYWDASWSRESYIHDSTKKLFVCIKESVWKSKADIISVWNNSILCLLALFFKYNFHFSFKILWKSVLKESRNFSSVLAMPISHWKEVTVFKLTEMRNRYPIILVNLIWVARSHSSLGSKGKLCHAVGC